MEASRNIVERIRWKSVGAVLAAILIVLVLLTVLPSKISLSHAVAVGVKVVPDRIPAGGDPVVNIEVENRDRENSRTLTLTVKTFDPSLKFADTLTQVYTVNNINVGPREVRRFQVKLNSSPGAVPGKYTVEVRATTDLDLEASVSRAYVEVESVR